LRGIVFSGGETSFKVIHHHKELGAIASDSWFKLKRNPEAEYCSSLLKGKMKGKKEGKTPLSAKKSKKRNKGVSSRIKNSYKENLTLFTIYAPKKHRVSPLWAFHRGGGGREKST